MEKIIDNSKCNLCSWDFTETLTSAYLIEDDEVVMIDGDRYQVKYNGINYSDPVSFKEV